jgi:DNA invertase Pin-like site-specific DNA recombinase
VRVVAYIRVSTSEQADSGAGLGAQRAAILAEVGRRGWDGEDVEWIEDAGFSAKNTKRPGLTHALGLLARGEAAVLMVSRVDRLSRSVLDFAGVLQRAQKEAWALIALDSPADLTTPQGGLMANVMIAFAEFERLLIGQRTKEALAVKKAQGLRLGRPCLTPQEHATWIRDQREDGLSLRAIAQRLNDDGVPTAMGGSRWYASTVKSVLEAA